MIFISPSFFASPLFSIYYFTRSILFLSLLASLSLSSFQADTISFFDVFSVSLLWLFEL